MQSNPSIRGLVRPPRTYSLRPRIAARWVVVLLLTVAVLATATVDPPLAALGVTILGAAVAASTAPRSASRLPKRD